MRIMSKPAIVALGVALPLCAVLVYLTLGVPSRAPNGTSPGIAEMTTGGSAAAPGRSSASSPQKATNSEQLNATIADLAQRLESNPDAGVEGWIALARAYYMQGDFARSASAYAEVAKRSPSDPQVLADYADALGRSRGASLQGEPEKILERALAVDPNNFKALGMAGRAAFDRGDYRLAVKRWEQLLSLIPPDSEMARKLGASLTDARARLSKAESGKF